VHDKLIPLAALVLLGILGQRVPIGGVAAAQVRLAVGALVIFVFAPALVLDVVLRSPLDLTYARVMGAGLLACAACGALMAGLLHLAGTRLRGAQRGALVLAGVFGNGLGMALPAVDGLLGGRQNAVPLTYDLLVTIPLVWTIGVLLAAHYGGGQRGRLGRELLRLPPFLALVAALGWKAAALPAPQWLLAATELPARAAVPLLALLVGLSLRRPVRSCATPWIGAAVALRLLAAPVAAVLAGPLLGLRGEVLAATVVTAAAPSVIVGVALCDRYKLDTALFGAVLTASTVGYVLLAPLYLPLAMRMG
jgi:malate permease and related proteins